MGRVEPSELVASVPGVEIHGKKLRITFSYKKQRCREVIHLPVTKSNVKFAINKLAVINHEIAIGTFDYRAHFPDSANADKFSSSAIRPITLFNAYVEFWQLYKAGLSPSTARRKPITIETCLNIIGKDKLVSSLLPKDLQALRIALSEQFAPSTANSYMASFSTMLRWCEKNNYCKKENLTHELKALRIIRGKSADPYSYEEYQAIINACHDPQHRNLVTLAFYTGLRTGELRALCWDAVDLSNRVIHIKRNIGDPKDPLKLPKTGQTRSVDLQPPAIAALKDQYQYTAHMTPIQITMHNGESLEKQLVVPVFNSMLSVKRMNGVGMYSDSGIARLWRKLLQRAKVRHRRFYQCRHTFASWNLTSHGNLAYIAKQMGHSDLEMLQSVYGKWIESASKSEAEMIWSQMERKGHFAPTMPQGNSIDSLND